MGRGADAAGDGGTLTMQVFADRAALAEIRRRYGIRRLSLFGSTLPMRLASLCTILVRGVAIAMAIAVFAIFMLKVVMRYGFGDSLAWADEVCAILFVWIIFWANAVLVPMRRQIAFDLVVHALPARGQRVAAVLRNLLVGGLFAAALPGSVSYIRFLWREHTPVLQLPLNWVYACFAMFLAATVVRCALALRRT
jgi:TRAP-type C4-dicarboxylate transport system permease small subunit